MINPEIYTLIWDSIMISPLKGGFTLHTPYCIVFRTFNTYITYNMLNMFESIYDTLQCNQC